MDKFKLRKECDRLFKYSSATDKNDIIDLYSNFFLKTIVNHHKEPVYSQMDADAKMVLQMMFTKLLSLKKLMDGISYRGTDGLLLNNIVDPTIIASLVRNIFETTAFFNLLYRNTGKQEQILLYYLWVISGLNYRQRFQSAVQTTQGQEKVDQEKKQIEEIQAKIIDCDAYKNLDEDSQKIIDYAIKKKDYLIIINGTTAKKTHWQELFELMEVKEGLMNNMYTYFSLYTHPSNVAVFQFQDLFKDENSFMQLTDFNFKIALFMLSIFIADYINKFPDTLKTFESLNLRDQIVINFYNSVARNHNFDINEAYRNLE